MNLFLLTILYCILVHNFSTGTKFLLFFNIILVFIKMYSNIILFFNILLHFKLTGKYCITAIFFFSDKNISEPKIKSLL